MSHFVQTLFFTVDCDFSTDICDWSSLSGLLVADFQWNRTNGDLLAASNLQGPAYDHNTNPTGTIMLVAFISTKSMRYTQRS